MSRFHILALSGVVLMAGLLLAAAPVAGTGPVYRFSDPHTHGNLTIFLIHGKGDLHDAKILTLAEALKQKKVIVHETKNVNELTIENISEEQIFIQAGDIVKGGQQDRTLALDVLLQPKSGRVPVNSFCVEQGRWAARGKENVAAFDSSANCLADNKLRIATRSAKSQKDVWNEVMNAQKKLGDTLKVDVKNSASQTSYQLTLENDKVKESISAAEKKLLSIVDDKTTDVIGYAVAINGKVNNVEVFANAALFKKLWPKLLQTSIIEALSEKNDKIKLEAVKAAAVQKFVDEAEAGTKKERTVLKTFKEVEKDTKTNVLFETQTEKGQVLRRSYLAK
jgi:hypothetical protein